MRFQKYCEGNGWWRVRTSAMTGMAKVSASWYYGARIKCKICHPFPYYQRFPLRRGDRAFAYGNNVHEYVFSSKRVSALLDRPPPIDPPYCLSTIRIGHRVSRTDVKESLSRIVWNFFLSSKKNFIGRKIKLIKTHEAR